MKERQKGRRMPDSSQVSTCSCLAGEFFEHSCSKFFPLQFSEVTEMTESSCLGNAYSSTLGLHFDFIH